MGKVDAVYKRLLYAIEETGFEYQDVRRSTVKRKQVKNASFELMMSDGLPLLTLKAMPFQMIVKELLWFLRGDNTTKWLVDNKVHIWDKDAYNFYLKECEGVNLEVRFKTIEEFVEYVENTDDSLLATEALTDGHKYVYGSVGRNYSAQWRDFKSYSLPSNSDQILSLVRNLKEKPMDSRHIVTAWNPTELDDTALPPCHWAFEILVAPTPKFMQEEEGWSPYNFSLKWHQRSVDTFLGLPFNIASYAILGKIIQYMTGIHFSSLIADLSNVHIYSNHYEAVKKLEPLLPDTFGSPELEFSSKAIELFTKFQSIPAEEITSSDIDDIFNALEPKDFILHHYQSYERISAEMVAPDKI